MEDNVIRLCFKSRCFFLCAFRDVCFSSMHRLNQISNVLKKGAMIKVVPLQHTRTLEILSIGTVSTNYAPTRQIRKRAPPSRLFLNGACQLKK